MPNELSEKVYPDGTVVKFRDDAAREQIEVINQNRVAVFEKTYTGNISNAWGAMYYSSNIEIDYSSLELSSPPKAVTFGVKNTGTGTLLMPNAAPTATKAGLYLMRPESATNKTVVVTATIIY